MVFGDNPVAKETVLTPPFPRVAASDAAHMRSGYVPEVGYPLG